MNAFGNSDISMAQGRTHQFIHYNARGCYKSKGIDHSREFTTQLLIIQWKCHRCFISMGNAKGDSVQWGMPERIQFNVPQLRDHSRS